MPCKYVHCTKGKTIVITYWNDLTTYTDRLVAGVSKEWTI